jgi:hypothetical protein
VKAGNSISSSCVQMVMVMVMVTVMAMMWWCR